MIWPPSGALADAVSDTVVVSVVLVMVVLAAAGLTASCSKLPPEALAIVADTLPASTYTSSAGAFTLTEAELAPAAIVIVAPFDSVTVTGLCAALVRLAV